MRKVAVVLFDDIEVLDFAGPFEVFSVCGLRNSTAPPFQVFTVAEHTTISARNKLIITPTYSFQNCPQADIVRRSLPNSRRELPSLHSGHI